MPEPNRITVKLRIRLFPVVFVLLLVMELVWSTRIWMMLLVALGAVWLLDYLWARGIARGLRLQRELRYDWAQVGDQLEERVTLTMRGLPPVLWVEMTDHSTLPDTNLSRATGVDADSENAWRTLHLCTRRGMFALGPTTLHTATPFGLYTIDFEYEANAPLLVMPEVVPLPEIQVAPGGRAREGRRRTSSFERTVSAAGVREYRYGDPFKAIYWRAVAHRDELMVRTFESTPAGDWWILLDLDESVQAGDGANSTLEHGVILAASLAERGLTEGRAVGLVANARQLAWIQPQSGESQRLEIMRALATVEPGARPLEFVLASARPSLGKNSSVIIITPAMEGKWIETLLAWTGSGTLPTVLLLDRAAYDGTANAERIMALLAEWSIPRYLIPIELFGRDKAAGHEGVWAWSVGATGRAIAHNAPHNQTWRQLQ
jgi:uncharacterized protein (DUF58 family)